MTIELKYLCVYISRLAHKLDFNLGRLYFNPGDIYDKFWNPINYAIIAGTGVLINMIILLSFSVSLPLWLANLVAIFTAWSWNWSMSVGPFGWLWGFKDKEGKKSA